MQVVLSVLSYILVVLTVLPLKRDNYWLFRILEYPRFQKFIIILVVLSAWMAMILFGQAADWIAIILLITCAVYLFVKIYPYTPMSRKEVMTVKCDDSRPSLRIFTANVLQDNRAYSKMIGQIKAAEPDLVILVETDEGWANAVDEALRGEYPHNLSEPRDNTYGLLFYSRFRLHDARIVHLVKDDIPSLDAKVELSPGTLVQLYGLHPEPPVPGESLTTTAKDKELMKVALKAKDCKLPCIVLGDLNDVAWSYTTSLFTKVSGLLDVRCGRGFYSTFSARNRFLRFPLDYIFCSSDFGLCEMRRLPPNGSDHFPISTHLVFRPDLENKQTEKDSDRKDLSSAREMAGK
jgi:endonuclease/exonuclease/phosphatase (EEP) superfamily protein YafD